MLSTVFNEKFRYPSYEIIGGKKIMAPSANTYHSNTIVKIVFEFERYFRKNKKGYVFTDSLDVHFPDGSVYRPDLIVVTAENKNIIDWKKSINGAPDLVVEVLSKSTMGKDLTVKKDTYEKFGVKEYWIVNPYVHSIMVYLLRDGKFEFDFDYICYDEFDFEEMEEFKEEDKPEIRMEISPSIFPEIKMNLHDIFDVY